MVIVWKKKATKFQNSVVNFNYTKTHIIYGMFKFFSLILNLNKWHAYKTGNANASNVVMKVAVYHLFYIGWWTKVPDHLYSPTTSFSSRGPGLPDSSISFQILISTKFPVSLLHSFFLNVQTIVVRSLPTLLKKNFWFQLL